MSTYRCLCGEQFEVEHRQGSIPVRCPQCRAPQIGAAGERLALDDTGDPASIDQHDSVDALAQVVLVLLYGGVAGLLTGYFLGGLCVGTAIVVNVIHNLLPVFVFIMPLIVLGFLVFSPLVYGMGVGTGVGYTAVLMRSRSGATAASIAVLSSVVGLASLPLLASWSAPPGTAFFNDTLMPFVCMMVGASLNFTWLAEPKPIEVAPWIVYAALGVSAGLGVLLAAGRALEIVEEDEEDAKEGTFQERIEHADLAAN